MKTKLLVWVLMNLLLFPALSFAQMKPEIPAQIKPPTVGRTYWCAEVKDILFRKEPQEGQKLDVGVRVKFRMIIPRYPRQESCECAFEGPSGSTTKLWSKVISLRLIGIKYSETEINLLEHHFIETPDFPSYYYIDGFPVVRFHITQDDLKKGYIDVWGWSSKEPLQCKDGTIYASLAVYNKEPYDKRNECHPHPDLKKSFTPKCGITYYCAKVEDILIKPEDFSAADKILVGVRLKFTKQGQEPCGCAFEAPQYPDRKMMSLRLIGLKYSETETNLLKFVGYDPGYYTYSGFQVIPIAIDEMELEKGEVDYWLWEPVKNPLNDNRAFKIQADLDINGYVLKRNDDPDYLKKGCFAPGNTIKTFKPRALQVPKIDK